MDDSEYKYKKLQEKCKKLQQKYKKLQQKYEEDTKELEDLMNWYADAYMNSEC